MRLYHARNFFLLTLGILTLCGTTRVAAAGGGSGSSKVPPPYPAKKLDRKVSTAGKVLITLGLKEKPTKLDHFKKYMPEQLYKEIEQSWKTAVEKGWLNPESGLPNYIQGTDQYDFVVGNILSKLDPYILEAGYNLWRTP